MNYVVGKTRARVLVCASRCVLGSTAALAFDVQRSSLKLPLSSSWAALVSGALEPAAPAAFPESAPPAERSEAFPEEAGHVDSPSGQSAPGKKRSRLPGR